MNRPREAASLPTFFHTNDGVSRAKLEAFEADLIDFGPVGISEADMITLISIPVSGKLTPALLIAERHADGSKGRALLYTLRPSVARNLAERLVAFARMQERQQ